LKGKYQFNETENQHHKSFRGFRISLFLVSALDISISQDDDYSLVGKRTHLARVRSIVFLWRVDVESSQLAWRCYETFLRCGSILACPPRSGMPLVPIQIEDIVYYHKYSDLLFTILVQLGLAIWVFILATKDRRQRWVWSFLSLALGVAGPILYFLSLDHISLTQKAPYKGAPKDSDSNNCSANHDL